jgi:signal transduction histidine kinase/CheY-like chemotaxis protein
MFEEIRNKYLYNKTQIVQLNKEGVVIASDDLIYRVQLKSSIKDFHPFFETVFSLIDLDEQDFNFSCIHLDVNSIKRTVDILFNSGSILVNPFLIFIDFTEHYSNFQSIAQEKNESVLSFHLAKIKNQQLESEKNFKNKFLANVSHDLKTPISASMWFVGMLEKSDISTSQRELVELLKETTNHIKELVDDILDLSKIEMGQIKVQKAPFDFLEMLYHVEKIIAPKARLKKLEFHIDKDKNLPKFVVGDKTRIVQIVINLLDNAIKFTKKGRVALSVSNARIENNNALILINVSDTGTGIIANDKEDVFKSFKKLHNSKEIDGSGLGLSIVSNLLYLMGGTIDYNTQVNVGTTFQIEIPLEIKLSESGNEAFEFIEITTKLNVLIVEDDEINQLLLMKLLLNHGGFNINIANDGFQALEMVEQNSYDLIFMDIEMPYMDGFKTTAILRKNANITINSMPIIGVSGHSVQHRKGISTPVGFDGYITKPFKKEEIFDIIYEVLNLKM